MKENNQPTITLIGRLERQLTDWLTTHHLQHERGAIVLFRRISRIKGELKNSDRFIAVEVIPMEADWILESSPIHMVINLRKFPDLYLRCENEQLELGFIHSHPDGSPGFSEKDAVNEQNILKGVAGCNGDKAFLISMILCEGKWVARVRRGTSPLDPVNAKHVIVLSDKLAIHLTDSVADVPENLSRQAAAFGNAFNKQLQSLRIAVVGLGGTGSPTATMLARCGVGELILIDGDLLERSNMNRVRGYIDTDIGQSKATSLARFIESLGLGTAVYPIQGYLHQSPEALDAISSADIIFGCTDDSIGRDILNQAIYYHAQLLIDLGLAGFIDIRQHGGEAYLRDHRSRVSCILPEAGACLRCQKVINDDSIKYQQAMEDRPELAELDAEVLEKEFYLRGGGTAAPGVGPFTGACANNAVATLMDLLSGFRDISTDLRQDNIWIDYVHMIIHSNEPLDNPDCVFCRTGEILVKQEKKYRLDTPQLGQIPPMN